MMLASIDPLLIPIVAITCAVGIPAVALAAHLVLRPMVRDITKAIAAGKTQASDDVERRLARLEDAYEHLDHNVSRLVEADEFRRQLERGREEGHGDRP
jgi:hypothetical protein